nr:barstar family protein [Pseudaestuariivita rosea]
MVLSLDCTSVTAFCRSISHGFKWQEQFGYHLEDANLDAINDGLRTPPFPASSKRLVISMTDFHRLFDEDPEFASQFLDIVEYQARDALLFGGLMLCFVQTDDPGFETEKLGGRSALWNSKEWLLSARGLN